MIWEAPRWAQYEPQQAPQTPSGMIPESETVETGLLDKDGNPIRKRVSLARIGFIPWRPDR